MGAGGAGRTFIGGGGAEARDAAAIHAAVAVRGCTSEAVHRKRVGCLERLASSPSAQEPGEATANGDSISPAAKAFDDLRPRPRRPSKLAARGGIMEAEPVVMTRVRVQHVQE